MCSNFPSTFNSDGFYVFESFLTSNEANELKSEATALIARMPDDEGERSVFSTLDAHEKQNKDKYFMESAQKISYFFEDGALDEKGALQVPAHVALNKIAHALHVHNPTFRKFTFSERVKDVCIQLGFQQPAIVQSMYIFKNPKLGGEVKPHQDATYLFTNPLKVVGFWIALEDAGVDNGCLEFIRGSHKNGVNRRYIRNPDANSEELLIYDAPPPVYAQHQFEPVPVPKGACILIDSKVVHCSAPNRSSKSRHVYTFHVIETANTHYSEQNWLQPLRDKPFLNIYQHH